MDSINYAKGFFIYSRYHARLLIIYNISYINILLICSLKTSFIFPPKYTLRNSPQHCLNIKISSDIIQKQFLHPVWISVFLVASVWMGEVVSISNAPIYRVISFSQQSIYIYTSTRINFTRHGIMGIRIISYLETPFVTELRYVDIPILLYIELSSTLLYHGCYSLYVTMRIILLSTTEKRET